MIPKKIHQIWITKNESSLIDLDKSIRSNIDYHIENNPGWTLRIYQNEDIKKYILDNYNHRVLELYNSINPEYAAAKADFFRYLLLYKEGGVYIDLKCKFEKPIEDVLLENDEFILTHWDNLPGERHEGWGHFKEIKYIRRGEYVMGVIISKPRHPILKAVINQAICNIKNYNPYKDGVGKIGVLRLTGPIMYSRSIQKIIETNHKIKYRVVDFQKDLFLNINTLEDKGMYFHKSVLDYNFNIQLTPLINKTYKPIPYYPLYFKLKYHLNETKRKCGNISREILIRLRNK